MNRVNAIQLKLCWIYLCFLVTQSALNHQNVMGENFELLLWEVVLNSRNCYSNLNRGYNGYLQNYEKTTSEQDSKVCLNKFLLPVFSKRCRLLQLFLNFKNNFNHRIIWFSKYSNCYIHLAQKQFIYVFSSVLERKSISALQSVQLDEHKVCQRYPFYFQTTFSMILQIRSKLKICPIISVQFEFESFPFISLFSPLSFVFQNVKWRIGCGKFGDDTNLLTEKFLVLFFNGKPSWSIFVLSPTANFDWLANLLDCSTYRFF